MILNKVIMRLNELIMLRKKKPCLVSRKQINIIIILHIIVLAFRSGFSSHDFRSSF